MNTMTTLALVALLLTFSLHAFDVHACNDWTARDQAYWKKMYGGARPFLFPLEPVSLSSPGGLSTALNKDGIKALGRGDYGEAERLFSEAIRTNPGSAPLRHNLALVFYKKLDLERAAGLWKEAVRLDRANPRYLYHLAFAFSSVGRAEEAIPLYQDLLRKMHKQPEIYNNLGQLFEFKGERGAGRRELSQGGHAQA